MLVKMWMESGARGSRNRCVSGRVAAASKRRTFMPPILALVALSLTASSQSRSASISIPRITHIPRLEDFVALERVPESAKEMAHVDGFIQRVPDEGKPVSEKTDVFLGYDTHQLYAIFVCHDKNPALVRAHLANRDNFPNDDDNVAIHLDTFHDHKHAYGFNVNALGVQADAIWTEGAGWDFSWESEWHSEGRLTDYGYAVLIAIPFENLRFASRDAQTWGIFLYRGIPRKNEDSYWPDYSPRITGRLNQEADASEIKEASPGRSLSFQPYAIGRSFRSLDTLPMQPRFASSAADVRAGVDLKAVIKDSLVLDLTANPDFSEIESDQPQITVNQRFELLFPEKRPFFIENASYFSTPIDLFFTRRIADPQFGARLTGRTGPYALGVLVSDDRPATAASSANAGANGGRALFGILRVNRDLGEQSTAGLIFTSRTFGTESNYVGGADTRVRLNAAEFLTAQAVTSSTTLLDGRARAGPAYLAAFDHNAKFLIGNATYSDRSPGFITQPGFIDRNDIRSLNSTLAYSVRKARKFLLSWGPQIVTENVWDHDGKHLTSRYREIANIELVRQTNFDVFYEKRNDLLRPGDFEQLRFNNQYRQQTEGFDLSTNPIASVELLASYAKGTGINFIPASGPPVLARSSVASASLSFRIGRALTINNTYLLARASAIQNDRGIFDDHTLRTKCTYYFSRSFYARTIFQFNNVISSPAMVNLQRQKTFNADFLFTYLPHPGTAVFVGYNSDLANLGRNLDLGSDGLVQRSSGFINDGRQVFVKVMYLFRR